MFCALIDLEKVYDQVPKEVVYWTLRKKGVAERMVQEMYRAIQMANRMSPLKHINVKDKNLIEDLVCKATDYAFGNGICMKTENDVLGTIPFTLFPSSFPRLQYEKVKKHSKGYKSPLSLGLFRTDYLLHEVDSNKLSIKQVETNTIASSFAIMASRMVGLHRYIIQNLPNELTLGELENINMSFIGRSIIVFLVENINSNIFDQRGLEYEVIKSDPKVKIVFATYKDLHEKCSLNDDNILFYNGEEVALVYLRTGYHPRFFTCENDWSASLLVERSKAIKCPPVQYHLAGCKKIQQVICEPGVLEKFISNPETITHMRETFAKIYSLEMNEQGNKAVELGICQPENYVLKPQREGGGNNLYGNEMKQKLLELKNSPERASYILMERIFPPTIQSYLVKQGQVTEATPIVSELGIYGYILGSSSEIVTNSVAGHVIKSKAEFEDEGGIAAGYAFIDSPNFI
ncbi:Glutathione synthetase [Nymphon striatum]|nr:Glutathione synthetase [Nymphon striatum]